MNNYNICPICSVKSKYNARYENYVCKDCSKNATDVNDNLLEFYNASLSGGFEACYKTSKEIYNSHICYINKIKCYAEAAYFGGIVIRLFEEIEYPKI